LKGALLLRAVVDPAVLERALFASKQRGNL
jgi:hypothetical protein